MTSTTSPGVPLSGMKCKPCAPGTAPLNTERINELLAQVDGWIHQGQVITKTYAFKNYYQTISFVNAVAWICNQEDHHPELAVSYNKCRVEFSTHDVQGLSENDFICAAKVDALILA